MTRRRRARRLVLALTSFAALSTLAGGAELVAYPDGNDFVPRSLLDGTAFSSFVVPGALLVLVGATNLVAAVLAFRRSAWSTDATLLAGGALTFWIADELAVVRAPHVLHAVYGATGVAILVLGVRGAWRAWSPRPRWVVIVTAAEAAGFLVPAGTGVATAYLGLDARWAALAMVIAGAGEGLLCGVGQATALPVDVDRPRFALATALGAALAWGIAMGLVALSHGGTAPELVAALGVLGGVTGLVSMGGAQALVLRERVAGAGAWIGWTALAWLLALPLSFAPGPIVDETTPAATLLVLWTSAGVAMAYVMALVTWQGARRLRARAVVDAPAPHGGPLTQPARA